MAIEVFLQVIKTNANLGETVLSILNAWANF